MFMIELEEHSDFFFPLEQLKLHNGTFYEHREIRQRPERKMPTGRKNDSFTAITLKQLEVLEVGKSCLIQKTRKGATQLIANHKNKSEIAGKKFLCKQLSLGQTKITRIY